MPTSGFTEADLPALLRLGATFTTPPARTAMPLPAAGLTEEEFLQAVRRLAHSHQWTTYHTRDSRKSDAGFPDLVMLRGERLLWRELKTERGELTADQLRWRDVLLAGGHDWALWRPSMWADICEELR